MLSHRKQVILGAECDKKTAELIKFSQTFKVGSALLLLWPGIRLN